MTTALKYLEWMVAASDNQHSISSLTGRIVGRALADMISKHGTLSSDVAKFVNEL
jgi:hypothetical protein